MSNKDNCNPLFPNTIFKDSKSIFSYEYKSISEVKMDSIYVLDTNVLLLPYTVGSKGLNEIRKTYKMLIEKSILFIPGQVAREFARNRPKKLSELYQTVSDSKSKVQKIKTPSCPLLDRLPEYQEALKIQDEINELQAKYGSEMSKVLDYIRNLNWDDDVSKLYRELISTDIIYELDVDETALLKELEERYTHNIPPGFKDKNKDDKGIGDLLIWKTILDIGEKYKKNLVFVSGDEKPDWFYQSMGAPLYPRYELLEEYRDSSCGKCLHIVSLSKLLEIFDASEEIVQEIQGIEKISLDEESKPSLAIIDKNLRKERVLSYYNRKLILNRAHGVCESCHCEYPYLEVHHIVPISQGGLDNPDNAIAICPNCHRQIHRQQA